MGFPSFASGDILTMTDMNAVGLWLIKTQTVGTAVSTVEVTGAFSSTYDNYLITLNGGTQSLVGTIGIQLGSSTTGYYGFMTYGDASTNTVLGAGRNNVSHMYWCGGTQANGGAAYLRCEIMGPNKAAYTRFVTGVYQNNLTFGTTQGEHRVATSYTAFTLIPDAGTLTGGTIRVYGYRN